MLNCSECRQNYRPGFEMCADCHIPLQTPGEGEIGLKDVLPSPVWEHLTFKRMATPIILKAFFWIQVAAAVSLGCFMLDTGLREENWLLLGQGVSTLLLGPLVARVSCEVGLIVFRILYHLSWLLAGMRPKPKDVVQQS